MSTGSGTNHTPPMSDEWDVPQDYFLSPSPYANSPIRAFPRDPPPRPISEQGWMFTERFPSRQHRFSRLPAPVPPFMLFDPMVTRPRMIVHEFSSSPIVSGQFNTQSSRGQSDSQLTADEQVAVLKKLRKDTYNPSPKRFLRMVSLYYRDQNSARARLDARDDDDDSKRCAVCLEDFESGEAVMITPCDHMFHEGCIVPWVKDHGRCPVCRFAMHKRETVQNQASRPPETVFRQWEAVLFVPQRPI